MLDYLLTCNPDGTISYETGIQSGAELYSTPSMNTKVISGDARAAHSFTSPFPCFMKVMKSSNVGGSQSLVSIGLMTVEVIIESNRSNGFCFPIWNVLFSCLGT